MESIVFQLVFIYNTNGLQDAKTSKHS